MFKERKFRLNLWLFGTFLTVLLAAIFEILEVVGPWHFRGQTNPLEALGFLLLVWAVAAFFWLVFPTYAGPDGVRATDGIGRFHNVPWVEMERVSSIFGFCWLRHGKNGKALLFPLFLQNRKGFEEYVTGHAPEQNSLRLFLNR